MERKPASQRLPQGLGRALSRINGWAACRYQG